MSQEGKVAGPWPEASRTQPPHLQKARGTQRKARLLLCRTQPPHLQKTRGTQRKVRRDWGQEKKGTTEDEMAGWHHQLNAQEFG